MAGFSIGEYVTRAQNFYVETEDRLVSTAKNALPEHLHDIAEKVCRAVPEIFCSLSLLTGVFKSAAIIYGVVKVGWAISPTIHALFTGSDMQTARKEAIDRLEASYEKFKPAIFVSFAVVGAASGVLGLTSFSPTLILTATYLGIISKLGYDASQGKQGQPVQT